MPALLSETPSYTKAKDRLGRRSLLALELVEEAIAADPHGSAARFDLGNGVVIDRSDPLLLVTFERGPPGHVTLVTFRFLRNRS